MNDYVFRLAGATLRALSSGALWWPDRGILVVADLHLGKSERAARRSGCLLPPYETQDTLERLGADIAAVRPPTVICLGDTFDDAQAAANLDAGHGQCLRALMTGRRWIWIEGNHDPGPVPIGGQTLDEHVEGPLRFRHIAAKDPPGAGLAEVSGHYHPKARIRAGLARPCFLVDDCRLIMPAYGTYTGGLSCNAAPFVALLSGSARALLLGPRVTPVPLAALRA
jgi:uncharacterized protein